MSFIFSSGNTTLQTMTYWLKDGYTLGGPPTYLGPFTFTGEYQTAFELQQEGFSSLEDNQSVIYTEEDIPTTAEVVSYESAELSPPQDSSEIIQKTKVKMITNSQVTFMYVI